MTHTSVLVVGGGLSGLTTAVMLATRGIPCLLVERHAGVARHPRARSVNVRTMELMRSVGLEAPLVAAGDDRFADFSIVIAESVTGRVHRTLLQPGQFDTRAVSPAPHSAAGQDRVEAILKRTAEERGADVRYATELVDLRQDGEGWTAVIRDLGSGIEQTVAAPYVVAADGGCSSLRQRLGIRVSGHGTLSHNIGVVFESAAGLPTAGRGLALFYLQNPGFTGAYVTTDEPNRALISVEYDPRVQDVADFDEARCAALVRAAVGIDDLPVRILEIAPWEMATRVAERLVAGRMLLVGDAAHTMPPTGGLGGQTAMQDGFDVAWKLAMVLRGQAGPGLIETYEAERLPVARLTVALQTDNYVRRMRPDRADLLSSVPCDYVEVALGYRLRSAAISIEEPDDGELCEDPVSPSGRPGTRMPQTPLRRAGMPCTPWDLIGESFLLMAGPEGVAWPEAVERLGRAGDLPLRLMRLGEDLEDPDGRWADDFGVAPDGAVLIRPDGYVAWRARTGDPSDLRPALERALCRTLDGA